MFDVIVDAAVAESPLWAESVRAGDEQQHEAVFSALAPAGHAIGLETIYEGYLVHYGRSRLFEPPDGDTALLLGDYLYADGLVRVAETGDVEAVADLADLISRCARLRAEGLGGDGEEWAATSSSLGQLPAPTPEAGAVARALAAHARLVG